jgi:hypothetical protein
MISLTEGEGSQSPDTYVELLMSEPELNGKAVLVIEDLIMLAVHGGTEHREMSYITESNRHSLICQIEVIQSRVQSQNRLLRGQISFFL